MSQDFELDQELTKFSLSLTKNIFAKVGFAPESSSPKSPKKKVASPVKSPPKQEVPSSNGSKGRSTSLGRHPSYNFGASSDNKGLSPLALQEATPRSHNGSPVSWREKKRKNQLDFSIHVLETEERAEETQNYEDESFIQFGVDEYSLSTSMISTVTKVVRADFIDRLHKEGWLEKKANKLLLGWQKRYFEVKSFKIYYAKTPQMLRNREGVRSINILVHPSKLIEIKENTFSIKIEGIQQVLRLRAESLQEAMEWVEFLKEFFQHVREKYYQSDKYHQQMKKSIAKVDMETEEDFLVEANTGDLLFFKKVEECNVKKLQKTTEHVALVVKISNEIFLYDTVNEKDFRFNSLKEFKRLPEYKNSSMVTHRKLSFKNPQNKEIVETRLCRSIMTNNDKKQETPRNKVFDQCELLPETSQDILVREASMSSALTLPASPKKHQSQFFPKPALQPEIKKKDNNQYSAKLIASIYKNVGLLDAQIPISKYESSSFTKKTKLLKDAQLSGEYELVFLN